MHTERRHFVAMSLALATTAVLAVSRTFAESAEPVIHVVAKKFTFTPNVITIKMGMTTIVELTTEDVVMGFNATEFGARATILPGTPVQVRLTPKAKGEFVFFCDVFCGTGHEDMNGTIRVV